MVDTNLSPPSEPVVTTPQTEDQLVEDLADLLEPPETDQPSEPDEDKAAKPDEDDDPLGLDAAEDVEETDKTDDEDGPSDDLKGGRFAPDSAKVKIGDETITIGDLKVRVEKRVKDFQRGFTQKQQALSAREQEVNQQSQSLTQFSEYARWYAQTFLPKDPGPYTGSEDDFVGYQNWQKDTERYRQHVQAWQVFQSQQEAETSRTKTESAREASERHQREVAALLKAMPVFRDPVKGPQAKAAIADGLAKHYGFTDEEIASISDHRFFLVIRDALKAKRLEAKAKEAPQQIATRPAKVGARQAPNVAVSKERQARTERLRQSGNIDDAAAAIADLL